MTELRAVNGDTEPAETQSFDDFWSEVAPKPRTETILGVEVLVPDASLIPMEDMMRIQKLQQSTDEADMHEMVGLLFGEGALADLLAARIAPLQLKTVLVWGVVRASGKPVSFRQAYEHVMEQEAMAEQGKASAPANRAERRAATRSRSAATGGRSKPTSPGSTASRRQQSAS